MAEMVPLVQPAHSEQLAPEVETYIENSLAALTLEQKVRLLSGADAWSTHDEPLIGLRRIVLSDGPAGVRGEVWDEREPSISFPSPTAWAATWDESLVERLSAVLAGEARRKGVQVVLGPTINLHRSPLGGRHFECLSEDPLLTGRIAERYVRTLQAHGVAATPKHYVANDSETERFTVDVRVGNRTLRELYLAPFERIVRNAGPWLVMAAYNAVNGVTMTENDLLTSPLSDEWGFDGVVVSDWGATRSTKASARAALDLTMPGPGGPRGKALVAAVEDGSVPAEAIDEKLRRLLRLAYRVGALEWLPRPDRRITALTRDETTGLLREAAAASMVLLRNVGRILPLPIEKLRRVAVIGPNAEPGHTQGGGSAGVVPPYTVSPLAGLTQALAGRADVVHAVGTRLHRGLVPFSRDEVTDPLTGEPGVRVRFVRDDGRVWDEEHRDATHLTWLGNLPTGTTAVQVACRYRAPRAGKYGLGVAGVGAFTIELNGKVHFDGVLTDPERHLVAALSDPPEQLVSEVLADDEEVELLVTHRIDEKQPLVTLALGVDAPAPPDADELARAVRLAADSDVAIVVVGTSAREESEGFDRTTLALPGRQDELVRAVAEANPRTVVVVNTGGPVVMPWRDEVPGILLTWFPGQEFGHALAAVLLGEIEPGGRLPTTWPASEDDVPVLSTKPSDGVLAYDEGLHVGYRAWAHAGAVPAFAFGHGLGYTTWELLELDAPASVVAGEQVTVRVRVRNLGPRAGRDVLQVYLSRPDSAVERPDLWLAGYAAVTAEPNTETDLWIGLEPQVFVHWSDGWQIELGDFVVRAGRSAADLPLQQTITVTAPRDD